MESWWCTILMQSCTTMNPSPGGWRIRQEKIARFNKEIATLEQHWPDIFRKPDPYYNPNLTLDSQDFSLKRL